MKMVHRLILAAALLAGIAPASAQTPVPVYGQFPAGVGYVAVYGSNFSGTATGVNPSIAGQPFLGVNQGGTGLQNPPANSLLIGQGPSSPIGAITPFSPGQILIDQGPGQNPQWRQLSGAININSQGVATLTGGGQFQAVFPPTGTFSDFVHDDAPAINAALTAASNAGGGWVLLSPAQPYWAQTQITVPQGVTLGCAAPPQKQLTTPNYVSVGCSVYLAPNNTIIDDGVIINAHILQDNIHFAGQPATTHALAAITANFASTGTGIKMNAADAIVEDVAIAGFNLAIDDNSLNRGSIRHVLMDATNCIKYEAVGDYSKGLDIECWTFYSTNRTISTYTMAISNVADNGSGSWRVTLSGAPSEALVTGDTVFIGGTGAIVIPQGALGKHTITVIDTTHFDLTGSNDAPSVSGTTTNGTPYVTGLATLADLWPGETFTGSCFTGTRTIKMLLQNAALIADANATSSGACTLTFASQAFSAGGSPFATFSGRTDWTGIGVEFAGGSASGGLFNNIYIWGHQVAFQFDANTITANLDTVSVDYAPSQYFSGRIGYWFKSGAMYNKITGNSSTSGGTAIWNQNGMGSLSQANIVKSGRVSGWQFGSIENDSGSLIASSILDPDNSNAAGQNNGDVFNVTGQNLSLTDGSSFPNSRFYNSTFGNSTQAGSAGFTTDTSYVGTQQFVYPPGKFQLGAGGNAGTITMVGSTSGLSTISVSATGGLSIDGPVPTSCASTGSGAGPSCAFGGGSSNSIGTIAITAGTTPAATGTFTVNFSATLGTTVPTCTFTYDDTGTAWNAGALPPHLSAVSGTAVTGTWNNNAVALTAASTYRIMYECFGK